jgi:TatD DNase family protein
MNWIDTHAHLYSDQFDADRDDMMQRSCRDGVKTILLPNIDKTSIAPLLDLVKKYPENCYPMMGLHPGSVGADWQEQLDIMYPYFNSHKMCAVGEIGMDLYWDRTYIEEQKLAFREQISWAKEMQLPIVIHAREAFDEIFQIIDDLIDDRLSGVFHCFTGNLDQAKKILTYPNFYMGIGGVVTYKKAALEEVLVHLPLDKLIMETDAPYLPPVPHRGKRNESAFLVYSAQRLADIFDLKLAELAEITSVNAKKLFKI